MSDDVYEYVYEMPPFSGEVQLLFEEDDGPTYKFFKEWEEAVNSSETGPLIHEGPGVSPMQAPSAEIFRLREKSRQVVNIDSKEKFLEVFGKATEGMFHDFVMKYEDEPTPPIWCERVKD
jgi:hypothetical protein